MLTEDENIVKVKLTVQYVIDDVKAFALNVKSPEQSLYQSTESAVRHVVGSTEMDRVLTEGRAIMGTEIKTRIQDYMNDYGTGIAVTQVNIDETAPPDAVREAFDEVIRAREDEVRVRNEANAYANKVIPEARGRPSVISKRPKPIEDRWLLKRAVSLSVSLSCWSSIKSRLSVTRERMYIDTLESVMSQSSKVMIDVEGGNNMMYLPLDRMVQRQNDAGVGGQVGSAPIGASRNSATSSPRTRRDRQ